MRSLFERGAGAGATGPLFAPMELPEPLEASELRACTACGTAHPADRWARALDVCPRCGRHERLPARRRLELTADQGTFVELPRPTVIADPLGFPGYGEKLEKSRQASGLDEAVLCGTAKIGGYPVALGIMDTNFMMGSMGAAVGESLSALSDVALEQRLPLILFCCSGGARMQEGMVSLMQMAKVSLSVERLAQAGLPYFAVLTDPTTGGVTASFAMLGDVILAEPGALIGFTGMRVIQQTLRQDLPEGFQRAEFMLEHGFIDLVVPRAELPGKLATLLKLHGARKDE